MEKKIKKIGIVLRPNSPNLKSIFENIKLTLEHVGIYSILESSSAQMINYCEDFCDLHELCSKCDMILSIGGDGTLIASVRAIHNYDIPIIGIHTGRLGFLTAALPSEIEQVALKLREGNYIVNKHLMLNANIVNPTYSCSSVTCCLNEFLLSRSNFVGMLEIDAYIDGILINSYRLDALIVGTPTGSSAYNISAGGSVVYPYCKNILLTPICEHSLMQRPMILSDEFELKFNFKTNGMVVCDGQQKIPMHEGSSINIKTATRSALLVQFSKNSYFSRLKDKFGWGA